MRQVFCAIIIILGACASGTFHENDTADASPCDGIPINFQTDVKNCGECGNICNPTTSDICEDGDCICSGFGAECETGTEACKLGTCVSPDPDSIEDDPEAMNCEWDHQCNSGRMCVLGICTEVPCSGEARIQECYSGSEESTVFHNENKNSPCLKGYRICWGGIWGPCEEEVLPVPERGILKCDGIDNDCDGCADGNWTDEGFCIPSERNDFDILFIFDTSSSMIDDCGTVVEVMRILGGMFEGNPSFRWGIVEMPAWGEGCQLGIRRDFSEYASFQDGLDSLQCERGSMEASWDAPYFAAQNIPMIDIEATEAAWARARPGDEVEDIYSTLSWRESATHVIIMFTDEPGQTYDQDIGSACYMGGGINDETRMCSAIDDEILAVVTEAAQMEFFDECASTFTLKPRAAEMVSDLEEILELACAD